MSTIHSKKSTAKNAHPPEIPPPRWIPPGIEFNSFPHEMQIAIAQIVNPIYEQLVLQADDSLEKSTGMTIVYLLWMEIFNQYQLGQEYIPDNFLRQAGQYEETFTRQLQLVEAKAKSSYILVRLREIRRHSLPATPTFPFPLPDPTPPAIALPGPGVPENI
jgi:hypothetical protein